MRKSIIIKKTLLTALILSLNACAGLFEKDNTPVPTPLTGFKPEVRPVRMWSTNIGPGTKDVYLKMTPAVGPGSIVTASSDGTVTSVNKFNGHVIWRTRTGIPLVSGPGIGDGIVAVVNKRGDVIALQQATGKPLWKTYIPGEVLSQPAISQNVVVVKSVDGILRGLSISDGHELWSLKQAEPIMILRGSSSPLVRDNQVVAGFANGNLVKVNLHNGQLNWQETITIPQGAFAIQRMIDIDADPIAYGHRIYVATYQGKIASLDWASGRTLWGHDISSYTGMTADSNTVYISDAKGDVWSFGANTGVVNWRQPQLAARLLTAPANMGNYIVVGDAEGYLHWLNKTDGHIAGRDRIGDGLYAAPIAENNVLYALTNNGNLVAYKMG